MTFLRFRTLLVVCLGFGLGFGLTGANAQAAPAAGSGKTHHIVFALTSKDEADWHMAVGNLRHLLDGLAPDEVEVEVVAYGPGVSALVKPSVINDEIVALIARHVVFVACENSMRGLKVTKADLVDGVGTVPAGIVEVVKKQEAGWIYVKAGR